jgi:transposase-like protein
MDVTEMTVATTREELVQDGGMGDSGGPRSGEPKRRRFSPQQKLRLLGEYEGACASGGGNAFLRENGLYSSLMSEWRRVRDAGLLEGKSGTDRVGRPSPEQAEIARLRKRLNDAEGRLARTEAALDIMGKARALLEGLSESADTESTPRKR